MTGDQKRPTLGVPFCGCVFLGKWRSSSESTVPTVLTTGFVQSLEFLKKSWVFFFFLVFFFLIIIKTFRMFAALRTTKKALFLRFKVSVDHLFDNRESWERSDCLEEVLEKVLNFGSKNLCEPCYQLFAWHFFSLVFFLNHYFSPSCLQRWWV